MYRGRRTSLQPVSGLQATDVRFVYKFGLFTPKWYKSGSFLRSVSGHFSSAKLIFKSPNFVPFEADVSHFVAKPDTPGSECL